MPSKQNTKSKKGGTKKAAKSRQSSKSIARPSKRASGSNSSQDVKAKPGRGSEAMAKVVCVVKKHGDNLRNVSGLEVFNVRPGYLFKNNRITPKPAVVVVINPRDRARKNRVPDKIGGVPVQVRMATPAEQLRHAAPDADFAATAAGGGEADIAMPGWDMMQGDAEEDTESELSADDDDSSKFVNYEPPTGVELLKVKDAMKVTCHVSPEQGWKQLSKFFWKARKKRLTIAMYDFTAPHVLEKLRADRAPENGKLSLILDPGVSKNGKIKANDVWEEEVRDTLTGTLDERFTFLWAAVKKQGKVSKGIFPTSYHIKVAVSGGKSFWLSSGNLESTNQPDEDSLDISLTKLQNSYNREWHVIVEHGGLASTYEKFIKQDMKQAKSLQVQIEADAAELDEAAAAPELLIPTEALSDVEEEASERQEFPPQIFTFTSAKPLKVHQVLTPDNFAATVVPVIKSAKKKLYFQNQYIKITENVGEEFSSLLDALLRKVADGIEDVRIILRQLPHAADELEALQYYASQNYGIDDLSFIRYQAGCHTKGIVVDSKVVVVGSHNWSNPGVSRNRDASLIFFDPGIAQYYERVFLHDFGVLAKPQVMADDEMPILSLAVESDAAEMDDADSNMTSVPWDFFEDAD